MLPAILRALENGKHVVTANKALLAHHGNEIFKVAAEDNVNIGFEASVGGSIPLIRSIREGLVAEDIKVITEFSMARQIIYSQE